MTQINLFIKQKNEKERKEELKEIPITRNQQILRTKIMNECNSTNWDELIQHFINTDNFINEDGDYCSCSHAINEIFVITHFQLNISFNIGNECIKQFENNLPLFNKMTNILNLHKKGKKRLLECGKYKNISFSEVYKNNYEYYKKLTKIKEKGNDIFYQLLPFMEYCKYQDALKIKKANKKLLINI